MSGVSMDEIRIFQGLSASGQLTKLDSRHGLAHFVLQVTIPVASTSGGHPFGPPLHSPRTVVVRGEKGVSQAQGTIEAILSYTLAMARFLVASLI